MANILLIEDKKKPADLISQFLQKKGYGADIAPDGPAALQALDAGTYDLILVDIKLEQMNGVDVCRKIRSIDKGRDILIVMMGGFVNDPQEVEQLKKELRLSAYLEKPFTPDQLVSSISSAFEARVARPAAAETPRQATMQQPPSFGGDLASTPFEKVLLYLMKQRATGILAMTRGTAQRQFSFIDGAPVELEPSSGDDDFGSYLMGKALIDAAEFREYEARKSRGDEDPRDIFIKMGCLTPQRFEEESRNYLHDRLIECFSWKTGSFLFEWQQTFLKTLPVARAFLPSLFYRGFKAHQSPAVIRAFVENKGKLYFDRTAEFYDYQNNLAAFAGVELLDLVDGLKTGAEIVGALDSDEAAVVLYTLDYLGTLSYSRTPRKSAAVPPFPMRERGTQPQKQEAEAFEDLGGELSRIADEMGALGNMKAPRAAAPEDAGLAALEENLKKQWEAVKDKNYYEIFGMTARTFSFDKLKKAYFDFTKAYGPEKFFASSSETMGLAEDFLSKISNAYHTLTNVVSKENYDELISQQEQVPTGEEEKEFYEQIQFQSGKVFLEQGQYDSAEKAFTTCMSIDSHKPEYYTYLALAIYNNPASRGNAASVKRAKDMINKSLQLGKLSIAYALKGTILLDEGSLTFAEAEFNKALKLNPNNKTALKNMEVIRERREQEKKGFFQRIFK
jgi:CheY-like chemotaxis protein/curved DNA-binding protein CbpA